MRKPLGFFAGMTLLLTSGAGRAQEVEVPMPVPSHAEFMEMCLPDPKGQDKDKMLGSLAYCQCAAERLPTDGDMVASEFKQSSRLCLAEMEADPENFTMIYAKRAIEYYEKIKP